MRKIRNTWQMMKASMSVLRQDTELLLFPMMSGLATLLVLASFALPLLFSDALGGSVFGGEGASPLFYLVLFAFYFVSYFVIIFFNAAIVACALKRMDGGDPTIAYGLKAAWSRLPSILAWALLSSTVGFILRMIEERVGFLGQIIVSLLGAAWTVTSFLVVPVLVHQGKGPVDAYKDSVRMLKQTWGEQIAGNLSFGLLFFLLGLPAIGLVVLAVFSGMGEFMAFAIGMAVIYFLVLGLVQSTLQAIYQAAVYRFAATGEAPGGFDQQLLGQSFKEK